MNIDCPPNPRQPKKDQTEFVAKPIREGKIETRIGVDKSFRKLIFEQDFKDIKDGLFKDIIKPRVKNVAYSLLDNVMLTFQNAIEMMIFGSVRSNRKGTTASGIRHFTAYDNPPTSGAPVLYSSVDFGTIDFKEFADAQNVLAEMQDALCQYPAVTVANLYDFAKQPAPTNTCSNYGWTNLDNVGIISVEDGYWRIDFPKPKYLK